MNILSAFILSTAINIDTLKLSFLSKNDTSISIKLKIFFASIITTVIAFLSFGLGTIIDVYFTKTLSNIFGSVLLGFTGIYYIVEHIRVQKDKEGFDTSYYVENFKKYKTIIESTPQNEIPISLKNVMNISIALSLNNIWPCIGGALTNISLPLTLLFTFVIFICFFICGIFISNKSIIKFISNYHYLITSFLLILLSLFESFI